jgi:hypothetical protein
MDVCQDLPLVVDVVKVERATIEEMISILECLPYKDVYTSIYKLKEVIEEEDLEGIKLDVQYFKEHLKYLRQVIMDMPVRKCLATTLLIGKVYGLIC